MPSKRGSVLKKKTKEVVRVKTLKIEKKKLTLKLRQAEADLKTLREEVCVHINEQNQLKITNSQLKAKMKAMEKKLADSGKFAQKIQNICSQKAK